MRSHQLLFLGLGCIIIALLILGLMVYITITPSKPTVYYYPTQTPEIPTATATLQISPSPTNEIVFASANIVSDTPAPIVIQPIQVEINPTPIQIPTEIQQPITPTQEISNNYDPSLYNAWQPYVEPTLGYIINLDAPNLDEEFDRVYYGVVGTRTPQP